MGGVPVKHHSKSKVGRRRSQLALTKREFAACKTCGGPLLPHRACVQCGFARSRSQQQIKTKAKSVEKKVKESKPKE